MRRRGGQATAGLLWTLVALGGLGAAAVIIAPRTLRAGEEEGPRPLVAARDDHQRTIETLGLLIGRSHRLLAVHARGPTPFAEILLWTEDAGERGRIDVEEIGLVSHSPVLQTLTFTALRTPPEASEHGVADLMRGTGVSLPGDPGDLQDVLADPAFCDRLRAFEHVTRRVLARGISDARFELDAESRVLEVAPTWTSGSADGPDKAVLPIDVRAAVPE